MKYLTHFLTYLDKYLKIIIFVLIILQIILVFLITYNNFLTYDKSVWFDAIKNIKQGKIPYLTTDEFVLGPSEYPILFTYFLVFLSIFPFDFKIYSIIFGLIQVMFSVLIIYIFYNLVENKKLVLILFLCPTF